MIIYPVANATVIACEEGVEEYEDELLPEDQHHAGGSGG